MSRVDQQANGNKIQPGGALVQAINSTVMLHPPRPTLPAIFTLPCANTYFEGRETCLREVTAKYQDKRNKNDFAVLCGPGGIGKTSIAYQYAHQCKTKVKIRIRTETIDTIKDDFYQVAKLLGIKIDEESLEDIVDQVYLALDKYENGIIVFDNVDSYSNPVREQNSAQSLRRYFPRNSKFRVLVTTRNAKYWPPGSLIRVKELDKNAAIKLFTRVSGLIDFDITKLTNFLYENLGYSALAICQAASSIRNKEISLDEYIRMYDESESSRKALADTESLPPELYCDGETPAVRRALFTTYDINIQSINSSNPSFLMLLRYAALMHPDDIGKEALYGAYKKADASFDSESLFEEEIRKTSLMTFEKDKESTITMHRAIKIVLLQKFHDEKTRGEVILSLLNFCSSHHHLTRRAYNNFRYILRNIIKMDSYYKCINISDARIIEMLFSVGENYIKAHEIDTGLFFITEALTNISEGSDLELRQKIVDKLIELFNEKVNFINISKKWLKRILCKVDAECRSRLIAILLEKEKELTEKPRYFEIPRYYPTVKAIAEAIIQSLDEKDGNLNHLAKSYHILGRAFREQAKSIYSTLRTKSDIIGKKEGELISKPLAWFSVRGRIKSEIAKLESERSSLSSDFDKHYKLALNHLQKSVELRKKASQYGHTQTILTLVQIFRLHQLKKINTKDLSIYEIVKHILENKSKLAQYPKSYSKDILECKRLKEEFDAINARKRKELSDKDTRSLAPQDGLFRPPKRGKSDDAEAHHSEAMETCGTPT